MSRPLEWWDRFFFEPQSTAPMTLVRVAWGAVMAVWAVSLLPDIDPFFTEGALLYERDLRDGSWNLLPHLGGQAGLATCVVLLLASLGTMVGLKTRLSAAIAVLCLVVLQRGNSAIFNSGDLLLRLVGIAVVLSPCGLRWSVDAAIDRRRGRVRSLLRAPFGMRLLQLQLAVGYLLSAWTKTRGRPGRTAPPSRGRCASRTCSASWPPTGCSSRSSRCVCSPGRPSPSRPRSSCWCGPAASACGSWGPGCSCTSASTSSSTSASSAWPSTWPIWPSSPPSSPSGSCAGSTVSQRARCRRATPDPSRSSQPRSTATARGSCLSRWPAPFMIRSSAAPWASTRTLASNTGTRSSSLPCTMSSGRGAR